MSYAPGHPTHKASHLSQVARYPDGQQTSAMAVDYHQVNGASRISVKPTCHSRVHKANQKQSTSLTVVNDPDEMEFRMAEHKRATAAFLAGSEARHAKYNLPNTIQKNSLYGSSHDYLKLHCLGIPKSVAAILPSRLQLLDIAFPEQAQHVDRVVELLEKKVAEFKAEMEAIFAGGNPA
jgi:hypothetical protein